MGTCFSKRYLNSTLLASVLFITLFSAIFFTACNSKKNKTTPVVADGTPEYNRVIDRATEMHDSGYIIQALHYLDSVSVQAPPKNTLDIFHYYYFFFDYYNNHIRTRDALKAVAYSDSMIYILEKNGDGKRYMRQYGQALFSKGDALFMDKNYAAAYKYFYEAKTIIKEDVDPCAAANYSYRLGMVLFKQDRFLEAAYYFEESYTEFENCDLDFAIFYRRQELLDNIGLSFSRVGKYDSAMHYYDAALSYIKDNYGHYPTKPAAFREKANAVIYGNMATVYNSLGEEDRAIALLNKSIAINQQEGFDMVDAQLNRLKMAAIYYHRHDNIALKNILLTVSTINDTIPDKNVTIGLYDMRWKYYQSLHEIDSAFANLVIYHQLRDSADKQMKALLETDMDERVKNLDKQYQISILEKNNELKKIYLIIALLGALLSGIIFLLILYNWQKSKANVSALTNLHDQVSTQKIKLEQLLKNLEESHKDKDRILRTVAHDIRNPIAAISSLTDLLTAQEYYYNEEQKELLTYIKNSCTDALSLTKEILEAADPSKAEALVKENVDVKKLLADSIEMLRFKATQKHQQVQLTMPESKVEAIVNREKIWRVISNLVMNAIKFSPPHTAIEVDLEQRERHIYISVYDKGIGIPESIKDKIFDMFTEAKRPGTDGERPFGLGLSISKQIVEAHHGKIWFETNADGGATFHVAIPVDDPHDHLG